VSNGFSTKIEEEHMADHVPFINPGGAPDEKIQEAIDSCPVSCIHWADEM
jgi:ferredoxin